MITTGILKSLRNPTTQATVYSFRNENWTQVESTNLSPDFRASNSQSQHPVGFLLPFEMQVGL